MTDVFLGVIAAAVLVMAVIQVAAVVFATRAARRLDRLADRLEQDVRPIVVSLRALTADAARATAVAAAQVERADQLFTDLTQRVEQTLNAVQDTLIAPAKEGVAWLSGLKAVLAAFRDARGGTRSRRAGVEDDEALFIG
ncbi:MAG: hypothetical protein HY657_01945 [Acidobacteria bacterium]|nr:hypothetical protein [Acidobacteriota bacterium]